MPSLNVDVHRVDGQMRVLATQCDTCIFTGAPFALRLRPGRLRELVEECQRRDTYIVCHETMAEPAVCRGFFDRFSANAIRVFGRLGAIVYVAAPHHPTPAPTSQEG